MVESPHRSGGREECYRLAFERSPLPKWLYDVETLRFVEVNAAAIAHYGYSREEFLAMTVEEIRPPDDVPSFRREVEKVVATPEHAGRYRHRKKDGTVIDVQVHGYTFKLEGRLTRLVLAMDVTEQVRAVEALRASEEQVRLLLDSTGEGIYGVDLDGRVTFANRACLRVLGYPDQRAILGRNAHDVFHHSRADGTPYPREQCRLLNAGLRHEGTLVDDEVLWRADGTSFPVEYASYPVRRGDQRVGAVVSFVDATSRRRAEEVLRKTEEQLRQAQKMEAIGRLTGGVAHDFNNILSVILSYSVLLMEEAPAESQLQDDLAEIKYAAERAARLTQQLLAFSRRQILSPSVNDLNGVVSGMEDMLRRLLGEDVDLVVSLAPNGARVLVDRGQIEQVIMNLAVNGRDAMPGGGKLTIEIQRAEVDDSYAVAGLVPGPYFVIAVTDNGVGMDAATQARIFEPFFTTKEPGKGTGLGLSTALGIVQQSGGHITAYSEPGEGTTFKVYLPPAPGAAVADAADAPRRASLCGTETILLVEDDERLRHLARTILARHGYQVLEARDGGDALTIGEQYAGNIALLLTDVVVPKLTGVELARRLSAPRPEMAVLYTSGYADDAVLRHGVLESGAAFVQKPFTPEALLRKVREVIEAKL
ncbi:MAG TPA: PAS domain S-box protein [Myxococcales bacterium]|nr:PAS domain S-box protein [Myxococcales bacterium]